MNRSRNILILTFVISLVSLAMLFVIKGEIENMTNPVIIETTNATEAPIEVPTEEVSDIIDITTNPDEYTVEEYEQRKADAHQMAELARGFGMSEDSDVILTAKAVWDDAVEGIEYHKSKRWWTDEDLDMLAALIYYEAGSNDCTDRHQQLVGQVVINRMNSDKYPNTIYGVITQTKPTLQYSTMNIVLKNMGNMDIIPWRCYKNAIAVLEGNVDCPDDVVYQANFKQGSGIYEKYKTAYGTSYFCYL